MIPEDFDHDPVSDSVLPAKIVLDAEDPKRQAFLKSLGKGAKYAAPTLTVLTFSHESLGYPSTPPFNPLNDPDHPLNPMNSRREKRG